MAECRHCGEFLHGEAATKAVRCPRCGEPLYEKPGGPELADPASPPVDRGLCAIHQGNIAIGTCKRCGNFFCSVCRTRFHDKVWCLACVERTVGNEESNPEERRVHSWQALLGLLLGLAAWIMVALAGVTVVLAQAQSGAESTLVLAALLIIASLLPSILGLGQAAAAIRTRGTRLTLATFGLVLSGAHVGIFVGLILLSLGRL